jgi:stress-induced morphogen
VALTDDAKTLIEAALPGAEVEIVDEAGGDHLRATVSARQFAGLSRIDQHKIVKAAIRAKTDSGEIHSFSIRTIALDD